MAPLDQPSGGGADETEDPNAAGGGGGSGGRDQTPQDVVKEMISLVSQATRNLEKAASIAARINMQVPGSKQQGQMIGQLLGQAQKQFAAMMADIVKTTSRQTEASTGPSPFGGQ